MVEKGRGDADLKRHVIWSYGTLFFFFIKKKICLSHLDVT